MYSTLVSLLLAGMPLTKQPYNINLNLDNRVEAKAIKMSPSTMDRTIKQNKGYYGVVLSMPLNKHDKRYYLFLSINQAGANVIRQDLENSINSGKEIDLNSYSAFQMGRGNQVKGNLVLPKDKQKIKLSKVMSDKQLNEFDLEQNLVD